MPPLLNHPCCRTVESMVITWREVYHCKKKRALPGLTFTEPRLNEPVRPASVLQGLGCCTTEAWSAMVSCTDLSNSTMGASIRTPYLCGMGDGDRRPDACGSVGNSGAVVSSSSPPEPGETGVVRAEVPMSCERLYSILFTLANSRSSTIAISRVGKSTVVVLFVGFRRSTPRRASREYVIPLTCSTQAPCTDQSGALFHPWERQAQYLRWDGSQERASYKRKHRGKGICVGRQAVRSQLKRKA
jgi:hypothetical protein